MAPKDVRTKNATLPGKGAVADVIKLRGEIEMGETALD